MVIHMDMPLLLANERRLAEQKRRVVVFSDLNWGVLRKTKIRHVLPSCNHTEGTLSKRSSFGILGAVPYTFEFTSLHIESCSTTV